MVTLETLMNLRIQLHMFVYPQHIDNFLNDVSTILVDNSGGMEYNAPTKQVIVHVTDKSKTEEIKRIINEKFASFLSSDMVANNLKPNINDQAFCDYKMIVNMRENYIFLYNTTILNISNVNEAIIVQL